MDGSGYGLLNVAICGIAWACSNLYTLDSSEVALDFTGCRKKGDNGELSPAWDTACYYLRGRKHHQYRADNRRGTCIFQKGVIHMAKLLC